jgi:hypothetical protein
MSQCGRFKNEDKAVNELINILEDLRELRGDDYLEPVKRRAAEEAILVTIEKH